MYVNVVEMPGNPLVRSPPLATLGGRVLLARQVLRPTVVEPGAAGSHSLDSERKHTVCGVGPSTKG
jgi:hypothetical protein